MSKPKFKPINQLIYSAMFIALGVLLPQVFHLIGTGPVFLPMHIPVLLCGFFLTWPYALAVGVLTPILSSIITSMPPLMPMLPQMVFELATYGAVTAILSSILAEKTNSNEAFGVYATLVIAMICGRIVACAAAAVIAKAFGAGNFASVGAWIVNNAATGWPGMLIQLIFIPAIVIALQRHMAKRKAVA